jgi:predicted RNase H-like nuclease
VVVSAKAQGVHLSPNPPEVVASLGDLLDARPAYDVIALDAPIGLLDEAEEGGRRCDRDARALLGPEGADSIHTPPTFPALAAGSREEASALAGGLDDATWRRIERLREVQREMEPYRQRYVFEVRPELCFFQLNGERPLKFPRRTDRGRDERRSLLEARLPDADQVLDVEVDGVRPWHLLDGCAALWTARRVLARAANRLPADPEWDARGLRMEILR